MVCSLAFWPCAHTFERSLVFGRQHSKHAERGKNSARVPCILASLHQNSHHSHHLITCLAYSSFKQACKAVVFWSQGWTNECNTLTLSFSKILTVLLVIVALRVWLKPVRKDINMFQSHDEWFRRCQDHMRIGRQSRMYLRPKHFTNTVSSKCLDTIVQTDHVCHVTESVTYLQFWRHVPRQAYKLSLNLVSFSVPAWVYLALHLLLLPTTEKRRCQCLPLIQRFSWADATNSIIPRLRCLVTLDIGSRKQLSH